MAVAFGTSGLRGPATSFDSATVGAYVGAFLDHAGVREGETVFLGSDLRASSPEISAHCAAAIEARNLKVAWAGVVPTPALALAALEARAPAIMVTGSHIPEDFNGMKFYRRDGELLKDDEAPIAQRAARYLVDGNFPERPVTLPHGDSRIAEAYVARNVAAFAPGALDGLRVGLYEHSAAGRDLIAEVLEELGATLVRFARADRFQAVDTEALEPEMMSVCTAAVAAHNLQAVLSTDGDGDRPLLFLADGRQVNGDVLCALAARALGIKQVATPLTCSSGIEKSGWFDQVERTRIGSPYVVEAMREMAGGGVAGFEANGGFMLQSDVLVGGRAIAALPTRDAVLPLIAVLAEVGRQGRSLTEIVADFPPRAMRADRIKQVPGEVSQIFLQRMGESAQFRAGIYADLVAPLEVDTTDGLRFETESGVIVHFRPSGNAPELRCYVETDSAAETDRILGDVQDRLQRALVVIMQEAG